MSWPFAVVLIIAIIGITEVFKAKHRAQAGITHDAATGGR
jgi:hypothetical protein